jgi:hypothetical protein
MQAKHSVTFTSAATDKIRRVFEHKPNELRHLLVCVVEHSSGRPTLELSLDRSLLASPLHAAAVSNGTVVVIPRRNIERYADLVVDFREGSFKFEGSAVPVVAVASDPGNLPLSREMLLALNPTLAGDRDAIERIAAHLRKGDRCAAIVVATRPLVVAAYSSEIDAVALLRFPPALVQRHALRRGTRLVTLNMYDERPGIASDLLHGQHSFRRYSNFTPIIAQFVSDDAPRIESLLRGIAQQEWDRASRLIEEAVKRAGGRFRDGAPPGSAKPAY